MRKFLKRIWFSFKNRGKCVRIQKGADIGKNTLFEGNNKIGSKTMFKGEIGYGSYIGNESFIIGKIGRFTSIGDNVKIVVGAHPSKIFISTHPIFYSLRKQNGETFISKQKFDEFKYADKEKKYFVIIENDIWIGNNAVIMQGVTIGNGAIIAANAVVTKDVLPYTIVAGIPAKPIKKRFNEEDVNNLLKLQWWNKPVSWIKANAEFFDNIQNFYDRKII